MELRERPPSRSAMTSQNETVARPSLAGPFRIELTAQVPGGRKSESDSPGSMITSEMMRRLVGRSCSLYQVRIPT